MHPMETYGTEVSEKEIKMEIYTPNVEHYRITNDKGNKFFKYNGWPSVCMDDRGVLYAVASSMRLSHVDPCGKGCMYMSYDQGKTWTKPIVLNDSFVDDRDMGICYLGGGKLLVSWFSEAPANYHDQIQDYDWFEEKDKAISWGFSQAWKKLPKEEYVASAGSFVMMSSDYGVTWSEPVRVPILAPHGPSVCKDGTLVYLGNMLYNDSYTSKDENGNEMRPPITCYTSTDGGYTWKFAGQVPDTKGPGGETINAYNMFEPHVVELPDGRLMGAIRTHNEEMNPAFTVFITYSHDKGRTWSAPVGTGVDGSPPHLMVHSSGAVVCSYSCRTNGSRCERAVVSYDMGETWTQDYVIDDRLEYFCDMGYPASIELPDGSILSVYYQEIPGEWWTSVLCSRWKLGK